MTSSRVIAPYITTWSTESDLPGRLVERADGGIAYEDEIAVDRDGDGVLWHRILSRHRQGRPEFGKTHPLRQRRAMRRLLCQVCARPADQNEDGTLWLLQDHRDDWPDWPNGMASVEPPVCLPCVSTAVRLCPALRTRAAAIRAREFPIVGVRGAICRSGPLCPVVVRETIVTLDNPAIPWVRATNLVRELRDCTIVPLERP